MKILSVPNKTIYVNFSNRTIYRKKPLWLRLANKFRLYDILLGAFAFADIYVFLIILFAYCQR